MINLPYLSKDSVDRFIRDALAEDIGEGDHSAKGAVPGKNSATARLLVKSHGILAGMEVAERIFHIVDPSLQVEKIMKDGTEISPSTEHRPVKFRSHPS